MSPSTILTELCERNVRINSANLREGTNTTNPNWPPVENWVIWSEFNARDLYKLFKDDVEKPWRDPTKQVELTSFDTEPYDEDSLEHGVLTKALFPSVNAALKHSHNEASATLVEYGRSGRTSYDAPSDEGKGRPDWALCSQGSKLESGFYPNFAPGDTKLAKKWHSKLELPKNHAPWVSPVSQVLHYCHLSKSRYGFIITDYEVVVFRCSIEPTGPSGMASRPIRESAASQSYHHDSSTSDPDISDMMQNTSLEYSSYYQSSDSGDEFCPVEYRAIPWTNHGDGRAQLTIRLALFYLAKMAGFGQIAIQYEYPAFDSWCWFPEDGLYMHNTTGRKSKKMPSHGSLQHFDPSNAGPQFAEIDGLLYLTRASAITLNIDRRTSQYYYNPESGEVVYLDSQVWVYDEQFQDFGFFNGVRWHWASTSQLTAGGSNDTRRRRRRK